MSRHRIVLLKGKGNRHFWPDKMAVPHVWSRRGPSFGFSPSDGAIGRPRCGNDREFTVISPELLRPAGWRCLCRAWPAGNDPVAVRC